jgi:hypothetical protein
MCIKPNLYYHMCIKPTYYTKCVLNPPIPQFAHLTPAGFHTAPDSIPGEQYTDFCKVRPYTHIHIHTYTHIHIYTHTHIHIYICIYSYTHILIYIHSYSYTHIHIYSYTYTHTHIHTLIHSYTHILIHILGGLLLPQGHTHLCRVRWQMPRGVFLSLGNARGY